MFAKYFSIFRNYVLLVSSQRKYYFYHQNAFLDAFRTNSRKRNPSMEIPSLANQDLTPMLGRHGEIALPRILSYRMFLLNFSTLLKICHSF